jgi:hypothetical protein
MYSPIKLANGTTKIEDYLHALIHARSQAAIGWREQWIHAMKDFEARLEKLSNCGPDFQNDKDYEPDENDVYVWGKDTVYEWMVECEIPKILSLFQLDQCGLEDMSKLMRAMIYYASMEEYPGKGDSQGSITINFLEELFYFGLKYKKLRLTLGSRKEKMAKWRGLKEDFMNYFVRNDISSLTGPVPYLSREEGSSMGTGNIGRRVALTGQGTSQPPSSITPTLPAITITDEYGTEEAETMGTRSGSGATQATKATFTTTAFRNTQPEGSGRAPERRYRKLGSCP